MAAAFAPGPGTVMAQGGDEEYVDVGIFLEVQDYVTAGAVHQLDVVVVNNGTRAAYDVEVVLDVEYPEASHFQLPAAKGLPGSLPVGNATLDGTGLRWTIPALGGLQREKFVARVWHRPSSRNLDNSDYPHELSRVVTAASYDINLSNNKARVWAYNLW